MVISKCRQNFEQSDFNEVHAMGVFQLGHTNLIFCFTSKLTQHFATLIYKCKLVGVAFAFMWYCGCGHFQDFYFMIQEMADQL